MRLCGAGSASCKEVSTMYGCISGAQQSNAMYGRPDGRPFFCADLAIFHPACFVSSRVITLLPQVFTTHIGVVAALTRLGVTPCRCAVTPGKGCKYLLNPGLVRQSQ